MDSIDRMIALDNAMTFAYLVLIIIVIVMILCKWMKSDSSEQGRSGTQPERKNYYNNDFTRQGGYEIVGVSGTFAGRVFKIVPGEDLLFGRDPVECQVVINDRNNVISRKHCLVHYSSSNSGVYITDYSHNGTFMDGKKLTSGISYKMFDGVRFSLAGNDDCFILRKN